MTTFIFPSDVFNPRVVDEAFQYEAEDVLKLGANIALIDFEVLTAGIEDRMFKARGLTGLEGEKDIIYRGWMLTVQDYSFLETSLRNRGIRMKTSMPDYQKAHQLPGWYDYFRDITPKSVWRYQKQTQELGTLADELTSESFIVKDFVKSRKTEWDTACFASSRKRLQSVADEFIRLQLEDKSLACGLVIREFESLDKEEGEARIWWVNGKVALITPHPDNPVQLPEVDECFIEKIRASVKALNCPFVTTDVALRNDGEWRVIEAGDGQVSGLPLGADASDLWKALIR